MRLLTGVLLASACVIVSSVGCRSRAHDVAPTPRLRFEPSRLALGPIVQDQLTERTVSVRNDGSAPLEVRALGASRFCSGHMDRNLIPPQATAALVVRCRSDLYGPLREGIDVESNDPGVPKATLAIVGDVTPLLAFDAPSVDLAMPFGEERSREVHLIGAVAARARPRLLGQAATDSEIVALPANTGSSDGYRLRCLARKVGANAGNIVVATGLDKPREVAIPYVCNVKGTLTLSPTNPVFNLKVSGDKAVRITVRSAQPGFEMREARIVEGPFAARFEHAEDDNTYRIDVTVLNERIPDEATTAVGTLLIVSNDHTEPRKEIPLFGSGRINKVHASDLHP